MLISAKIMKRQSEIRQSLAELAGKETPSDDETRSMETLDGEYSSNETRYRAALISEDTERRQGGAELETRTERQFSELVENFELRQVALSLDEGRALTGQTAEVVEELRNSGGYRGVPVPYLALEQRAGETVASGTPDPISTRPIIDRLFPGSVAGRMGAQMISIDSGAVEWPVVTSSVTAAWAASELGAVGTPTAYTTTDKAMAPNQNLGVQMKISRRTLKQSGTALEQAVRRDVAGAIGMAMDRAVFQGSGSSGEPLGAISGYSTYGITSTAVDAAADWAAVRSAVTRFMTANAAGGPGGVRMLIRPELWDFLDGAYVSGTAVSQWELLTKHISSIAMTSNALDAPAGSPTLSTDVLLTTSAGGVAPLFVGLWGAVDMIRDPYSDATSGGLRITGIATMDVTVARGVQLEILTGLEL